MTPERWAAIKSIFDEVSNHGSEHSAVLLDRLCQGDTEMRLEVTRLLDADRRAATFLDSPVLQLSPDAIPQPSEFTSMVGRRMGPYRIVREIGHGGMGTVYLAERDDAEFSQRVALKVVREVRSERVLKWFRYERQILAGLEHPNIARLLDGGTTEAGIPYARSRFTNVPDLLLARDLTLTPLGARTNDAQYIDASYDVAKGARLGGTLTADLTATYRFERVEPLYRTVGKPQAVAADVFRNTFEIAGGLGKVIGQISHARSHDNLERITSILTTHTQMTNATLAIPIASLRAPNRSTAWLPTVSYILNETRQVGEGAPPSGGFASPSQVPDQRSANHILRSDWTLGPVRAGYGLNVSRVDNRQQGREAADFETVAHLMTLAVSTGARLDLAVDLARDRAASLERGTVTRTSRVGFNGTWRITTDATVASILGRTSIQDPAASRNDAVDMSVQYTHALPLSFDRRDGPKLRAFTRWSWQSADLIDLLFGLRQNRDNWTINSGLSVSLF